MFLKQEKYQSADVCQETLHFTLCTKERQKPIRRSFLSGT